jgi:DNA invertase Pin-like site-specific DNA recombinase
VGKRLKKYVVIYYRASTPGQGKRGLGLRAQKRFAYLFVDIHGYTIVKEFREVHSGKTGKRRGIHEAIDCCKAHNATLLIADMERLSRDMHFVTTLMESKVEFTLLDHPNADRFMKHLLAAFADREWYRASERTKRALAEAKAKGVKLGTDGEKLSRHNKKKRRKLRKRVLPIIKRLRAKGFTIRQITDYLNRRRIAPFRGKYFKWHVATVHRMMAGNG